MNGVMRYSDMQIAGAFIKSCMAIKGIAVPDTERWVRAIDYDALHADFLNAVQGRDIAISERDALAAQVARLAAELAEAKEMDRIHFGLWLKADAKITRMIEESQASVAAYTEAKAEHDALRAELNAVIALAGAYQRYANALRASDVRSPTQGEP